jgi:hypothetical protein
MAVPRFQFSIRLMLAATAWVAAAVALLAVDQDWRPNWTTGALAFIVMMAVPAVSIVGIVYAGTYCRAFCVGALIPSLWTAILLLMVMRSQEMIVTGKGVTFPVAKEFLTLFARNACTNVGASTCCSLVVGLICALTRSCLDRSGRHED